MKSGRVACFLYKKAAVSISPEGKLEHGVVLLGSRAVAGSSLFQSLCETENRQYADDVPVDVKFEPLPPMLGRSRLVMMVVVPSFTKG